MKKVFIYKNPEGIHARKISNEAGTDVMNYIEDNASGYTAIKVMVQIEGKAK